MWKKALSSKGVFLLLLLLLAFVGNLRYKQWISQKDIEANIESLKQQESERTQKAKELADLKQYLDSSDFKEKVARQQLGYKKTGENVYGFSEVQGAFTDQPSAVQEESNAQKWWNYFFN